MGGFHGPTLKGDLSAFFDTQKSPKQTSGLLGGAAITPKCGNYIESENRYPNQASESHHHSTKTNSFQKLRSLTGTLHIDLNSLIDECMIEIHSRLATRQNPPKKLPLTTLGWTSSPKTRLFAQKRSFQAGENHPLRPGFGFSLRVPRPHGERDSASSLEPIPGLITPHSSLQQKLGDVVVESSRMQHEPVDMNASIYNMMFFDSATSTLSSGLFLAFLGSLYPLGSSSLSVSDIRKHNNNVDSIYKSTLSIVFVILSYPF